MAELISLQDYPDSLKIEILNELGYKSDGIFVLEKDGSKLIDKYIEEPVKIENMLILPGSEIILDNNPLSVSSYMEEFKDVL